MNSSFSPFPLGIANLEPCWNMLMHPLRHIVNAALKILCSEEHNLAFAPQSLLNHTFVMSWFRKWLGKAFQPCTFAE